MHAEVLKGSIVSVYRKSYHIITAIGRTAIAAAPVIGFALAFSMPVSSQAHSSGCDRLHIMHEPLAGMYDNTGANIPRKCAKKIMFGGANLPPAHK